MIPKKIFNEYHHTSWGMDRNGKSRGQSGIEYNIDYSRLSLKQKYYTKEYIARAIVDKDIFTEKELKKYLMSLRRQKILTETQANDIFELSMGILSKQEDAPKAPELNDSKSKAQIKTPRYDKLMLEMQEKSASRLEAYKNRNKLGRPFGKSDEDSEDSDKISSNKSSGSNNKSGRGTSNRFADSNESEGMPSDKITGSAEFTWLSHDNFSQPRLDK